MSRQNHLGRRRVLRSIGAAATAGLLAGCSSDPGSGDQSMPDDETTPESTPEPTPEPTTEATTEATPESTPEPTAESTPEGPVASAVAEANAAVESINEGVQTVNDGLENVEPVAPVDPVEAETAEEAAAEAERLRGEIDRLQSAVLTQVPKEINEQAGFGLVSTDLETPADARAEAEDAESLSSDAATALRDAADFVESIEAELSAAAETLESV